MINIWLILDLIAVFLITFRDDCKMFYQTITYDLKQKTYGYWSMLMLAFLIYLPLTIPYSIMNIIRKNNGNN